MHDYSIDRHPKEKIIFFMSYLVIILAPQINNLFNWLHTSFKFKIDSAFTIPLISIPIFSLFFGIYWLFDNVLWKFSILRKFLLVPDLNGEWEITGKTIYNEGKESQIDWNASLIITQSWSKISIILAAKASISESFSASMIKKEGVGYLLNYAYKNTPSIESIGLQSHQGIAFITFEPECVSGNGEYFTDHNRQTSGKMTWRKKIGSK
ncbi:MAG: hypothetical protein F9K24_13665 [Leptonema illini]|uniref:CD-NTase-associated protein 15 domain-containing protein n=1 Tax=Leptonema illini TaxID=183 RepID=A0A833LXP5_9LEPT|nr:MAG: hypothetical protein F9K24_13665 [Leptonema illini]